MKVKISSPSISIRSHFLPMAPLIALGSKSPNGKKYDVPFLYTLLHEYLHFEDYTYWPATVMRYMRATNRSLTVLQSCLYLSKSTEIKPNPPPLEQDTDIPLNTKATLTKGSVFSINGPIGIDALLEASAILNYRVKPPKTNYLYDYSEAVVRKLVTNPIDENNLIHTIGVRLLIRASTEMRRLYQSGKSNYLDEKEEKTFYTLAATLPSIIMRNTFGHAMLLNGFKNGQFIWQEAFDFVAENFENLQNTYLAKTKELLHKCLIENDFNETLDILPLRDLSIVGYHCYITLCHNLIYANAVKLFGDNMAVVYMHIAPLLSILKLHEALNKLTLSLYKAPNLKPHWIAVPVIFFPEKALSAVALDFDLSSPNFRFKWINEMQYDSFEYHYFFSWIRMAFTNSQLEAIDQSATHFCCPIYRWVNDQYSDIGGSSIDSAHFLMKFCNSCMACDFDIKPYGRKVNPSHDFCSSAVPGKGLGGTRSGCFFHANIAKCTV